MDEIRSEIIEDLVAEYIGLLQWAEAEPTSGADLSSALQGWQRRIEPRADDLATRALELAGHQAPRMAREIIRRTPNGFQGVYVLYCFVTRLMSEAVGADLTEIAALIARECVSGIQELGQGGDALAALFIVQLLDYMAASGAAPEALNVIGAWPLNARLPQKFLSRATGMIAYSAKDYPLAISSLEEAFDELDCRALCALGESYSFARDFSEALQAFRHAALRSDVPDDQFTARFGIGRSLAGCASDEQGTPWGEAVKELELAVEAFGSIGEAPELPALERLYECHKLLGYARTHAGWQTQDLSQLRAQLSEVGDLLRYYLYLTEDETVMPCRDEPMELEELHAVATLAGSTGALADILTHTHDQLAQQLARNRERESDFIRMARLKTSLEERMHAFEAGGRPFAERIAAEHPGIPDKAAQELGLAQWKWEQLPHAVPPQDIARNIGAAVEVILREGLCRRMCEYAAQRAEGQQFLATSDDRPQFWLGKCEGRTQTKATTPQVSRLLKESASVRQFVKDTYSGRLQTWLLNEAPEELAELGNIRNPASHGDSVAQSRVPWALELLLQKDRLRRLLVAGGLEEQHD